MLIPPQAIEAEQSVLGAMLLEKQAISEVIKILTPEDFYKPEHVAACEKIYDLYNSNKPVDIITTGIDIGLIEDLTKNISIAGNVRNHAMMVKGKSIRRKYIRAAQEVQQMAYAGEYDNFIDFKNDVLQKMDIEVKDSKKDESSIKSIVNAVSCKIEDRYNKKDRDRFRYGFQWIDEKTGGLERLTVLAARPSIGKSSFVNQIALNLADKGLHVAMFNLEMDKEAIVERMLANMSGVQIGKLKNPKEMSQEDWEKYGNSQGDLAETNIHIFDDIYKVEEIRATCRELKNKKQLDFVIVDYLQLCDTMKKTSSINERVSYLSRQFKLLQKEMGIRVWVLSQLNRANEHDNRRPKLTDLRDSGAIEQDADCVIFLHDPNYGKYQERSNESGSEIEFMVAKEREGERDILKVFKFYKKTQRWYDK